jgi:hypothetical protein
VKGSRNESDRKPILIGDTHRIAKRGRFEKAPMAVKVIWLKKKSLEVKNEAT